MAIRARIALLPLLLWTLPATVHAQRQSKESLEAIARWAQAVNEHVPGQPDASVAQIAAMTYTARRDLHTAHALFMRVLTEQGLVITHGEIDKAVTRLARALRADPGGATFVRRAAVLHLDALVFAGRFPRPRDDAPPPPPPRSQRIDGQRIPVSDGRSRPPPLLRNERVVLTRDGEVLGETPADWNLPFARSLLDEFFRPRQTPTAPQPCAGDVADALQRAGRGVGDCRIVSAETFPLLPEDIGFAGAWYHAAAAFLFATGKNGDATDHLQDGARVLPDDPRVLFDRGTYAETLGLPIYQAVQEEAGARPNAFIARIPAEAKTNEAAEQLYRRALEVDPENHEARVRLARLLDHRGQRDEAASQIAHVLDEQPSGVVGYYALTIAGRVAAGRSRYEEALDYYRRAAAMYRGAQSALLGASHAALMLGDVAATLEPLEVIGDGLGEADPWLDYQLGAGRDVNRLLIALWTRAGR